MRKKKNRKRFWFRFGQLNEVRTQVADLIVKTLSLTGDGEKEMDIIRMSEREVRPRERIIFQRYLDPRPEGKRIEFRVCEQQQSKELSLFWKTEKEQLGTNEGGSN